jgi:hypothetical protein
MAVLRRGASFDRAVRKAKQNISIHFAELPTQEKPVELLRAHDGRHAGSDCLILDGSEMHLSFVRPPCRRRLAG